MTTGRLRYVTQPPDARLDAVLHEFEQYASAEAARIRTKQPAQALTSQSKPLRSKPDIRTILRASLTERLSEVLHPETQSPQQRRPRRSLGDYEQASQPDAIQIAFARSVMVNALTHRGFPSADAEDAAQDVLLKIARDPAQFADRLQSVPDHAGWFVNSALQSYLMLLRSERRRRRREAIWEQTSAEAAEWSSGASVGAVLELAAHASLTFAATRVLGCCLSRST